MHSHHTLSAGEPSYSFLSSQALSVTTSPMTLSTITGLSKYFTAGRTPYLSRIESTVAAFDIIGGFLVFGSDEHLYGDAVLDELAHEHKGALIAGPAGLGHVVGDD